MGIVARTFDTDGSSHLHDPAEIVTILERSGELIWVDVHDPTTDDFERLIKEFGLHPLAVEDAKEHGQRPKLEHYANHWFLVAYSQEMAEVDLFIGPDWLVTVRERNPEGEVSNIDAIRVRFEREGTEPTTVGHLVYVVLDELVDGYLDRSDELEDEVEGIEEHIMLDQIGSPGDIQRQLLALRRQLLRFRKVVLPLRDVLARLQRGEVDLIDATAREQLQDVLDHAARVVDQLDQDRELIANAADAHQSLIANRMNQVMKRMTSWGALLLGSTLIAGIYGMNFEHMPELRWQYGYLWALGLMAATTVVGYRYFKRKGWL
ncbi:MAG: magnesium/cobalt transporter CorA [Acidimicrobiales bacterium]